jgi:beta-fructofuranosidase
MRALTVALAAGEVLHVFLRHGRLTLHPPDGATMAFDGPASDDFGRIAISATQHGQHRLAWDAAAELSLVYAFHPAEVRQQGIRVLHTTPANRIPAGGPLLHFSPPFGWMNDPNGLCRTPDGLVHVFYQHHPHGLRWNNMHWGHAVTRDLLRFTHLPVFLHPRPPILAEADRRGGAYSGSALPLPDGGIRVFHTDRDGGRLPEWEWQVTAVAPDALEAGPPTPLLTARPALPGFGHDWRDPYVLRGPDGGWCMLVGGRDAQGGCVLLYRSRAPDAAADWRLHGVLWRTEAFETGPCECPCLVRLRGEGDGLWALTVGLLRSHDAATGRRNLGVAVVGRFDGERFEPVQQRVLDDGTDCYAFQAFEDADGPIGLGWAANWAEIDRQADTPTVLTLFRRLVWRDGALLTPPHEAHAGLRAGLLVASGTDAAVPEGCAELELVAPPPTFRVDCDGIAIVCGDGVLRLEDASSPVLREARLDRLSHLRVVLDRGVIEVYADHGRACLTRRRPGWQAARVHATAPFAAWRLRLAEPPGGG